LNFATGGGKLGAVTTIYGMQDLPTPNGADSTATGTRIFPSNFAGCQAVRGAMA